MVKYIFSINGTPVRVIECNVNPPQSFLEEEISERIDLSGFDIGKITMSPGTATGIFGRITYYTTNVPRTRSLRSGTTGRNRAYVICSCAARLTS